MYEAKFPDSVMRSWIRMDRGIEGEEEKPPRQKLKIYTVMREPVGIKIKYYLN